MRIGIDIDGVITNMYEAIIDNATKYCYENKINYNINPSKYYEGEILNISDSDVEKFWNKYLGEYAQNYPTREYASEVISKMKEENEIYIITSRNEFGLPPELYGSMQNMVKKWLKDNNIQYDKIIFTQEKLKTCIDNNINIMIEDCPDTILELAKEIKTLCFDTPYNKQVYGENIIRVYSWYDVLNIIENGKNFKP